MRAAVRWTCLAGLLMAAGWLLSAHAEEFAAPGAEPQVGPDGQVPRTEEAKKLAKALIARMNAAHYSLLRTPLKGLEAAFDAESGGAAVGTLAVKWSPNLAVADVTFQGAGPKPLADLAQFAARVSLSFISDQFADLPGYYAARSGGACIFELVGDPRDPRTMAVKKHLMTVSADLRLMQVADENTNGKVCRLSHIWEPVGPYLALKSVVRHDVTDDVKREWTLAYTVQDSLPFFQRVDLQETQRGAVASVTLKLQKVTFYKDAAPPGWPTTPLHPIPPPPPVAPPPQPPGATQAPDDPTYGYARENPIKVGMPRQGADQGPAFMGGPQAEREYLRRLRDAKFRPFRFQRRGSVGPGPDGHILDLHELGDEDGGRHLLYLDMYHPEAGYLGAKAPKGMYFEK